MQRKFQKRLQKETGLLLLSLACGVMLSGCASSPRTSALNCPEPARPTPLPETVTASDSENVKSYSQKVRIFSEKVQTWQAKAQNYLQSSQQIKK